MRPRARAAALMTALAVSGGLIAASPSIATAAEPVAPTFSAGDLQTPLPAGTYRDMAVDDAHRQVFVAMTAPAAVHVFGFDGVLISTVTGLTDPSDLAVSPDDATLYVVESGQASLAVVDTATFAVARKALPATHCPVSVLPTADRIWYSHQICGAHVSEGSLSSYDPATGEVTESGLDLGFAGSLTALPDHPERVFYKRAASPGEFRSFDLSGDVPVQTGLFAGQNCADEALTAGAALVVLSCYNYGSGSYKALVLNMPDLSAATPIPLAYGGQSAVAASTDGRFVALANAGGYPNGDQIDVVDLDAGPPGMPVRTYVFSSQTDVTGSSLAFTGDGRLIAITDGYSLDPALHILSEATKHDTSLSAKAPARVILHSGFTFRGTLTGAPATTTSLTVSRTDPTGTYDLGTVPVAANGTWSFANKPITTGDATYRFTYAGTETHASETLAKTVKVRPVPYDVNGDGYADTVIGAPGENLGDDTDTGQLHVLYGSATGTTGTNSKAYHQDSEGVPGSNEDGDQFGYANAGGDFNGDGYGDIAVSAPFENIGSARDVGEVFVFYGSATGLRTTGVGGIYPAESGNADGFFGLALSVGDFDGDGVDDLAAGAPGNYGRVYVYRGSPSGLSSTNFHRMTPDGCGVPGDGGSYALFGFTLSSGDINGDARDDLAIGSPYAAAGKQWSTGSVIVVYDAAPDWCSHDNAQEFYKEASGVPGGAGTFDPSKGDDTDAFGWQVVLADFDGDGDADLATAAPGAPVTGTDGKRKADAGTVTVLYSSGTKIATTGAVQVNQATSGMPGGPGSNDFLGSTLAAGDTNLDGKAELAVYSPGDDYVTVIPGATGGLAFGKAKGWTQDSGGIPGGTESGDGWGGSLRFGDVKGNGYLALIVGAPGEDSGRGAATVVYSGSSGLTGTGAKFFSQDSSGVPGGAENGDGFGIFYS